jgi:uncharacterized protein (DUF1778 family)
MPLINSKKRTRMLNLRLSEEEYRLLHNASLVSGSRSVSDYARDSLFRAVQSTIPITAEQLKARMDGFEVELHSISRVLLQLHQKTGHAPGNGE